MRPRRRRAPHRAETAVGHLQVEPPKQWGEPIADDLFGFRHRLSRCRTRRLPLAEAGTDRGNDLVIGHWANRDQGIKAAVVARSRHPKARRPRLVGVRRGCLRDGPARRGHGRASATCSRSGSGGSSGFRGTEPGRREGGTAIDPELVALLLAHRRADDPLDRLTPRERDVLTLMAEGLGNIAIACSSGRGRGTQAHPRYLRQTRPAADRAHRPPRRRHPALPGEHGKMILEESSDESGSETLD